VRMHGHLTAWAAQYTRDTLQPATARTYELPSIDSDVSAAVLRFLMGIEHPSQRIIRSVNAGVRYLNKVKLTGIDWKQVSAPDAPHGYDRVVIKNPNARPIWGRFYEIGTNRPIFSGRDGAKKYKVSQIEYERRTNYGWYDRAPLSILQQVYPAWRKKYTPDQNVLTDTTTAQ